MNADHTDAMVLYCKAFSKATEITSVRMTGVDRYGFDMSAMTACTRRKDLRLVLLGQGWIELVAPSTKQ